MIIIHLVSKHFARGCKEKVILKEKKSISNSGKFIKVGQYFKKITEIDRFLKYYKI